MDSDVTGIGWVTATGTGCGRELERFQVTDEPVPDKFLADLPERSYPSSRRMDRYSKLGLVALTHALRDAGLDQWSQKRNIGIVVATEFGCLNTDIDYFDTVMSQEGIGASPALFAYTLPSVFLGEAAIRFGFTGTTFVINVKEPLGLEVVNLALESKITDEVDKIICGVCNPERPPIFDSPLKPFSGALFFVIENSPEEKHSYGRLRFTHNGIDFNGKNVKDLCDLVKLCLYFHKETINF